MPKVPLFHILAERVATLICEDVASATNSEFMVELNERLERKGFIIEAHQQGVRGTYICIVKKETKK